MHTVFEKASALGEAIQQSEEYRAMRAAEDAVMADAEAARVMGEFVSLKTQVEEQLSLEEPDHEELARLSLSMEALQDTLSAMELVQRMTQARASFSDMMRQVNQVLRFMVTGEMEEEDCQGGCQGDCGCCGGDCGKQIQ